MQRCDQMNQGEYRIEASKGDKFYRVRAFLPDDDPSTCDCVAFAISRNRDGGKLHGGTGWCKHLAKVMDTTCQWQEGLAPEKQTIAGVCPKCGGTSSEGAAVVLPESPTKAAEIVTDKLLAMMQDLEGRQASEDFDAQEAADDLSKFLS